MITPIDALLITFCLACSLTDILETKIYNSITISLLISGVLYHAYMVFYPEFRISALTHFLIFLGFGVLWALTWFLFFYFRIVAAGDVKFFLAIYAWVGFPDVLMLGAFILIASGILSFIYMVEDGRFRSFLKMGWLSAVSRALISPPDLAYQKPLGFAMFMGAWAYILWK